MFNLLPPDIKKSLKAEYTQRRAVAILFTAFLILCMVLVLILPTWFSSTYKGMQVEAQAEKMNNYLTSLNVGPTTEAIKSLNLKMQVMNSVLDYRKFNPIVDTILAQKFSGIIIDQVAYRMVATSTAVVTVGGIADSRENLVLLSKKLQASSKFKSVDIPISNYAKEKDIEFSINLVVSDQAK